MMCNLPITALYDGSSVDLSAGIWKDRTGNGNDGIMTGSGGGVFNDLDTSNSLYLNDQEIFYGTPTTHVEFPMTVTPRHTVINLCKYSKSGVALYYNQWITDYYNKFGDEWVLSMQSNTHYYGNGVKYTTSIGPEVAPGTLGINTKRQSDFACAEVIVINDIILSHDEIQCFEEYFNEKYGFDIVAPFVKFNAWDYR
eukprot:548812_1